MNLRTFLAVSVLFLLGAGSVAPLAAAEPVKPAAAPAPTGLAGLLASTGLSQAQVLTGLKTGLGVAINLAATDAAKPGAFQLNAPASMAKLEGLLKAANQTGALDSFKTSLSASAASVAPQALTALKTAVGSLSAADVAALGGGGNDAATKLLRKVAEPTLRTTLMPLVAKAIAANGTAAQAKSLAAKAGPMAAMLGVPGAADLEGYVFSQLLDATFGYVAKGEAAIRANPALLKDKVAAALFKPAAK